MASCTCRRALPGIKWRTVCAPQSVGVPCQQHVWIVAVEDDWSACHHFEKGNDGRHLDTITPMLGITYVRCGEPRCGDSFMICMIVQNAMHAVQKPVPIMQVTPRARRNQVQPDFWPGF